MLLYFITEDIVARVFYMEMDCVTITDNTHNGGPSPVTPYNRNQMGSQLLKPNPEAPSCLTATSNGCNANDIF